MRLAVVGADGKMGRELLAAVKRIDTAELAGAVVKSDSPYVGKDAGLLIDQAPCGIILSDDPLPVFAKVEGVLDFTSPEASVTYAAYAAQARIVHVIGTTGFSKDDEDKIKAAAAHATIVKSGNMSLGVNVLASLVKKAAKALSDEYDIEIAEMHHRRKVDAPSGTALLLGQAAAEARHENLVDISVRGRDGHTGARKTGTIGFSSLRGGTVVGDHSVIFAGENERIVLSHFAQERSIFADGAVKAALWAQNRKHGLYSMADVLGLTD